MGVPVLADIGASYLKARSTAPIYIPVRDMRRPYR
jgi:hypothetical protein